MRPPTALPAARIFDRVWTQDQLRAVESENHYAAQDVQHFPARLALSGHGLSIDGRRIRALVEEVMGGREETYYIVAALCHAHLAISFPDRLTDHQRELLLSPVVASEMVVEVAELGLAA